MAKKGGIFYKINRDALVETAGRFLRIQLSHNPVYPFEEVDPGVYIHTVQFQRLYISIAVCSIVILLCIIVFSTMGEVNEYIVIPILILAGFLYQTVWSWKTRTYVLDNNEKKYEFYRGKDLIYRGDYHNVYIRLKGVKSGGGSIYYSVVLNGFNLDEETITPQTTSKKDLAKVAKRLAKALNLNFFDSDDVSKEHIILHQSPYVQKQNLDI